MKKICAISFLQRTFFSGYSCLVATFDPETSKAFESFAGACLDGVIYRNSSCTCQERSIFRFPNKFGQYLPTLRIMAFGSCCLRFECGSLSMEQRDVVKRRG